MTVTDTMTLIIKFEGDKPPVKMGDYILVPHGVDGTRAVKGKITGCDWNAGSSETQILKIAFKDKAHESTQ